MTNHLTPNIFGWIVEREKKVNEDHPLVMVNIGPGFTKTYVCHSIFAIIGHTPGEIEEDPRAGELGLTMRHCTHRMLWSGTMAELWQERVWFSKPDGY